MDRPSESPSERQLSMQQLDEATGHTFAREMQATGIIAIPTAVALAAIGNLPLAAGAAGLSVISLGLAHLQIRASKKKRGL